MKLNIVRIVRKDTDKEGKPLVTKDGRPYTRLAIQAKEYGAKWLSGFSAPWNDTWVEGQIVEIEVEQKGEYLNIVKPDPFGQLSKAVFDLNVRIGKLETRIDTLEKSDATPQTIVSTFTPAQMYEPPDEEPKDSSDLPF